MLSNSFFTYCLTAPCRRVLPDSSWSSPLLGTVLVGGRLLAAVVEMSVVVGYLGALLRRDVEVAAERAVESRGQSGGGAVAAAGGGGRPKSQ